MKSGTSLILVVGMAWLGLTTTVGFAQKPAPARARPAPAASPAPRQPQGALKATTSAAPSDHNAVIRRYCVGCHSDTQEDRRPVARDVRRRARRAECRGGGEGDPQAAGGDDAAAALAAPRRGDAGRARHDARNHDRRRRRGETESRRSHVPAPQSARVRARGAATCWGSTSTPATGCRSIRRARTSTTSRTCRRCRRRCSRRTSTPPPPSAAWRSATATRRPSTHTYTNPGYLSQHPWDHVEGAPYGTRGGMVVNHVFPADAEYVFEVALNSGSNARFEDIDISINGERVALIEYESGPAGGADGRGARLVRTEPILVRAGQQRVAAAFVRKLEGPYEDLIRPHDWSFAGGGSGGPGITTLPHVQGPDHQGTVRRRPGISETASRQKIFTCRPTESRRRAAVRAADRLAPRRRGVPPAAHERRNRSPDAVLRERARRRADSRAASAARSRRSWPARTSSSASRRSRRARGRAGPTASPTSTSRRGCRSSCGARCPIRSC